jgi:hypothetical protein
MKYARVRFVCGFKRTDLVLQAPPAAGRSISVHSLANLLSFHVAQSQFLPIHTEQRCPLQRKVRPPARMFVPSPGVIHSTDKCSGSPDGTVSASGSYYTDPRINSRRVGLPIVYSIPYIRQCHLTSCNAVILSSHDQTLVHPPLKKITI